LEDLLRDAVAGDPMPGMRWTHTSIRTLWGALRQRGLPIGPGTWARLLNEQRFSLRTNCKRLAGTGDPDQDRPFRYLARVRRWSLTRSLPVISVDAKNKELLGPCKNPVRCWRRSSREVLDHDFPRWALGRDIPYEFNDVGRHARYVVVGIAHATGQKESKEVRRKRRPVLPRWNYPIDPRPVSVHGPRVTKGERHQSRACTAWA
jgi:hypothetical protein